MTTMAHGGSPASIRRLNDIILSDSNVMFYCFLVFVLCFVLTAITGTDDLKNWPTYNLEKQNILLPDYVHPMSKSQPKFGV